MLSCSQSTFAVLAAGSDVVIEIHQSHCGRLIMFVEKFDEFLKFDIYLSELYVAFASKSNRYKPIRSQSTLYLPPENIRKPYGFLMFSGVSKSVHWEKMG